MRENYYANLKIPVLIPALVFEQMPVMLFVYERAHPKTVMIFVLQEKNRNFCCINIVEEERKTA